MRRLLLTVILGLVLAVGGSGIAWAVSSGTCGGLYGSTCGVGTNPSKGDFHGLIAVKGAPWVLARAAHSGTKAACGDCVWTLMLACPHNTPGQSDETSCTDATHSPQCKKKQLLYRVYLTTDELPYQLTGTVCLGGPNEVVPIGDEAAAAVRNYLKDVHPPGLVITTQPRAGALAGLAEFFAVRTPADLRPQPFGGDPITETITIAPLRYDWTWGDGTSSGWTTATGGP